MSGSAYRDLAEVLEDDRFPRIDLDLRRGRHIGREDGEDYTFLMDALKQLEPFYLRFGCQLVSKADGYMCISCRREAHCLGGLSRSAKCWSGRRSP